MCTKEVRPSDNYRREAPELLLVQLARPFSESAAPVSLLVTEVSIPNCVARGCLGETRDSFSILHTGNWLGGRASEGHLRMVAADGDQSLPFLR